ncbi:MAG: hypothetical dipeptidyl aminopeptidase/ acylaminoacyl-peptidase related protein [Candidatus Xenobia bacterium]
MFELPEGLPRRHFLGGAAAGLLFAGSSTGVRAQPASPQDESFSFFRDPLLNFNSLFAAGASGLAAAFGEVAVSVDQARAGGASLQSWYDASMAMGGKLTRAAEQSLARGHRVSARARFLRAASFFDQALFFVLGSSTPGAEKDVYLTMDRAWSQACLLSSPVYEEVAIPYESRTLPGWFLKPPGSGGRRPTLIVNNGSDAQNVDTYVYGGAAALERGWNALLFEGPGQGSMLFVDEIPFRPDWERVITPIVDFLLGRPDVDSRRIALSGWSLGGGLVARAAAFEPRLAAVVIDPGFVSAFDGYPAQLREIAKAGDEATVNKIWSQDVVAGANAAERFNLLKRLEIYSREALLESRAGQVPSNWYQLSRTIQKFNVRDVAGKISMPALVLDYAQDNFVLGQAADLVALMPPGTPLVTLGPDTGSQYHCAPMNPQWRNEVVFDWLEKTLS